MFTLSYQNKSLVDCLLQEFYKDKLFEIIANVANLEVFRGNIPDLAQMLRVDADIYRDFQKEPLKSIEGFEIFDKITDRVLKFPTSPYLMNMKYLYDTYLSKALTIKNLYGIVGRDLQTGEVINFTNPFRLLSLIHQDRMLKMDALYIYKKEYQFDTDIRAEKQKAIDNMLTLLLEIYKKGIRHKKEIVLDKMISLQRDNEPMQNFIPSVVISTMDRSENRFSHYSYLYFSDILLYNSFCPHYAVYNLKIVDGKLFNNYFKHIPMFSPNLSLGHKCCTGRLDQLSIEGIESLKISNLSSPFFTDIFEKTGLNYYIDLNIAKSKEILKENFMEVNNEL